MENFEKNSVVFQKEKRRQDMVVMASQQAVMEANLIANISHFNPNRAKRGKYKSANPIHSTFHKYKCKNISTSDIIKPLRKRYSSTETFDKTINETQEDNELEESYSVIDTQ